MPITPFHFGPGGLLKSVCPKYFSLTLFCAVNILTDCETVLYFLITGYPAHRWAHSLLGATALALFSTLTLSPILRRFTLTRASWKIYFVSAFLGTYSHIFLDSIMHSDIQPLRPFSSANPLLQLISLGHLHLACILAGFLAIIIGLVKFACATRGQP